MTDLSDKEYEYEYERVKYPDVPDKPSEKRSFDAAQRRAWLLDRMYELGTPTRINQSEVCTYFGVAQSTISKDISEELAPYVEDRLGDRVGMMSDVVFKAAVEKLMDDNEPEAAARVMEKFNNWLQSSGNQESETQTDEISVQFGSE
ncbi:hypothetical protein BRD22_02555 [Halobacteriales archaeon SW_8_68_21]|nr:MAG: hypothetical protein BRD22_02555 [Halobacteriales archaeon SW_8_68_21]